MIEYGSYFPTQQSVDDYRKHVESQASNIPAAPPITEIVRMFGSVVKDGRTLNKIFAHAEGEMDELWEELESHRYGESQGEDGIVGEAIDVIACLLDLIYQYDPDITDEQISHKMLAKCIKWKKKSDEGAYKK